MHVVFVSIIMVVVLYIMPMKNEGQPKPFEFSMLIFTLLQVSAFYFTAYVLHPRLLSRKKVVAFIFAVCSLSVTIALVPTLSTYFLSGNNFPRTLAKLIVLFIIGLFVMGTATSYRFIIDAFREQQIRQDNLVNELSFLRSQVSPHFMFNTLNSLVALARKQSDKLEPALMKMSGLMHYMLYDSDEEKVSLDKEISYIQSYIDLQTMRFGNTVPILFGVNQQGHYHSIEPMLLIPLIENAFKHGTGIINQPEINIQLDISETHLKLYVLNHADPSGNKPAEKPKGIGLVNLKKRLQLLYPSKHKLIIESGADKFISTLIIEFKP